MSDDLPPQRPELAALLARRARGQDASRAEAVARRHARGYRTARENLADLIDEGSFLEYGELAVAAQRNRRDYEDLQLETPADGVITGIGRINSRWFPARASRAAVAVYDYTVLAGTQGHFHHAKLDRLLELAQRQRLPVVMYTEGGGGRPGDTDVTTQIAGLNVPTFARWAALETGQPRIAVNNGYCFAGNAALFGTADLRIATESAVIGMAGPAMIEGGGLGTFEPTEIGPAAVQWRNGLIDLLVEDEQAATTAAKCILGYFQGDTAGYDCADQRLLRDLLPEDRRWGYPVRRILETLFDSDSFLELQRVYGRSVITGLGRLGGRAVGVLASDCQQLGGAVDSEAADKATRFLQLCDRTGLPVVSLVDTPGFMVGPASEEQGGGAPYVGAVSRRGQRCVPSSWPYSFARDMVLGPWRSLVEASRCRTIRWPGPPASSAAWALKGPCAWAFARSWMRRRTTRRARRSSNGCLRSFTVKAKPVKRPLTWRSMQ